MNVSLPRSTTTYDRLGLCSHTTPGDSTSSGIWESDSGLLVAWVGVFDTFPRLKPIAISADGISWMKIRPISYRALVLSLNYAFGHKEDYS